MLVTPSASHWARNYNYRGELQLCSCALCSCALKALRQLWCSGILDILQVVYSMTACRHYASCDAALQAAVSRHKGDCADVTKKRAKKEVLRLTADLLTAVEDLAT